MADKKISQLTTKTTPTTSDVLPIVDAAASDNKKITIGTLPVSTPVQSAIDAKIAKAAGATYTVNNVLAVTAAEYAAIVTPDANTIYFIV